MSRRVYLMGDSPTLASALAGGSHEGRPLALASASGLSETPVILKDDSSAGIAFGIDDEEKAGDMSQPKIRNAVPKPSLPPSAPSLKKKQADKEITVPRRAIHRASSDGAALFAEFIHSRSEQVEKEEVTQCRCECCGHSEECTEEYRERIRQSFCGKWICGLCAEATEEEKSRKKGNANTEEALREHMSVCVRFNSYERPNPAGQVAHCMTKLLRNSSSKSSRLRVNEHKETVAASAGRPLARSSSCMPAFAGDTL